MTNYSKLFGSIIGGVVGLLVTTGTVSQDWANPELMGSLSTILGAAFGTYVAPANRQG